VICAEVSRAGDGLVAALKVIEIMLATGQPLSALRRVLRKYPQSVLALKVREKLPLEQLATVQEAIRTVESELAERGRICWCGIRERSRRSGCWSNTRIQHK
jgi:phosphoglucosamine mutase